MTRGGATVRPVAAFEGSSEWGRLLGVAAACCLPLVWKQLGDLLLRHRLCELAQNVGEVVEEVEAVGFRRRDDAVHRSHVLGRLVGAREQIVAFADPNRPKLVLDRVVGERQSPVLGEAGQRFPVIDVVIRAFEQRVAGSAIANKLREVSFQFPEDRDRALLSKFGPLIPRHLLRVGEILELEQAADELQDIRRVRIVGVRLESAFF